MQAAALSSFDLPSFSKRPVLSCPATAIAIARLWALTGCRRTEIASLKWAEVDLDRGLLILDDSKTGKSIRLLSLAAMAILRAIERDEESEFVFPAASGESHYQGTKRIWEKAKKAAGLPDITPHTLRHTIGSTAVSNGEALALTGAILGHANARSTAIYAHIQHQPMKRAAERVGSRIATALGLEVAKSRPRRTAKAAPGEAGEISVRVAENALEPSR